MTADFQEIINVPRGNSSGASARTAASTPATASFIGLTGTTVFLIICLASKSAAYHCCEVALGGHSHALYRDSPVAAPAKVELLLRQRPAVWWFRSSDA